MTNRIEPRTLKGFKDYLPEEARLRQKIMDTCREVFELYGFQALDTPVLEYADILENKIGEDEKLIYKFEDRGGRQVAMRYDLTVSLARLVAQNINDLKLPFRRFQIGKSWRADNPQKGRYREFVQADADIVGVDSLSADAECVSMYYEIFRRLNLEDFKILINSRKVFDNLAKQLGLNPIQSVEVVRVIDKVEKIGLDEAKKFLAEKGLDTNQIKGIEDFLNKGAELEDFNVLKNYLDVLGVPGSAYKFDSKLARGADYYTGTIFEPVVPESEFGSLGGGGRYDNLVQSFLGKKIPAVGASVGVDRLLAYMIEKGFKSEGQLTRVIILNLGQEFTDKCLQLLKKLRAEGIASEYFYDAKDLDKQFRYAESLNIPYAILLGEEEVKSNKLTLRDLKKRNQRSVEPSELISTLK